MQQFLAMAALLAFGLNAQCAFLCSLEAEHPCCPQQRAPACANPGETVVAIQHSMPNQLFESPWQYSLLPPLPLQHASAPATAGLMAGRAVAACFPLRV
ncbi:MAG: hypothetical protein M3N54_10405 [Acidobacteriota bacterium]|nr:hypothetical protein [Acidobacteriota bacterium]